ncbi:6-hydroxynicotinate reductase [Variovorax sp. J22G73]|uniref:6-hydroxynicotinate reductase n=1 Tax=unclassified Variovorax TaxID=663243 RepID=UPI002578B413|nr:MULTISPECIES: 6-hydroxynicotinate reductase [unclassified Variovorax]MDM0007417.1 6-hydroxynicotinate reductase [Variovorax sp. J22R203]MDM0100224.1 6-hydroxynicotinate reductase [Variovorax sp. J22G73]
MTEHTKTDGLPGMDMPVLAEAGAFGKAPPRNERMSTAKVECNACPVLCQISDGRTGACDRYANKGGVLVRVDPVVLLRRTVQSEAPALVPFNRSGAEPTAAADAAVTVADPDWNGDLLHADEVFVTGVGSSTTYPDYKPAPFIVASKAQGVDMVTVVTEGIFSYCSFKVKIDTDRFLGSEQANVRYRGEVVGHVTTAEYGSQMLSLGGVHHLTGGSKKEGRMTAELMQFLGNKKAVECTIDGGSTLVIQAGKAPIVNGVEEQRMRVGCGSAAVGIFARQFAGVADEVVVVDDHITGVLTEHQAGRCLDMAPSGIQMLGRKSTPGRYFQVANPGNGWGGTDIADPLSIIEGWEEGVARPGLRLLMTSTTGEHAQWYVLDDALKPVEHPMPAEVKRIVERIGENCEPSLCTVLFLGGAGGSLRAGVTENPVLLTRAIKRALVNVTCGGAPAYVWPGGGITVMADVMRMPDNSFGTVPTPAIVAPIEFSMRRDDYEALGGHMEHIFPLEQALARGAWQEDGAPLARQWLAMDDANPWPLGHAPMLG